jgi:hypothetical protein
MRQDRATSPGSPKLAVTRLRRGFLTIILAVVRMKLKAVRVTFKYSGPVQCRDWLESPLTQPGGFFFEGAVRPFFFPASALRGMSSNIKRRGTVPGCG